MDTPARYGGDEFVVVMPEAGLEAVQQLSGRITRALASDGESPILSASIGAAGDPIIPVLVAAAGMPKAG
jgi:GGDEF domain-containing protein